MIGKRGRIAWSPEIIPQEDTGRASSPQKRKLSRENSVEKTGMKKTNCRAGYRIRHEIICFVFVFQIATILLNEKH